MTLQQQALVEELRPYATSVAKIISKRTPIDFDELHSLALLGLCEAAIRYSPDKGVPFKRYAAYRMNGRVGDYIREIKGRARNQFKKDLIYFESMNEFEDLITMRPTEEVLSNETQRLIDRVRDTRQQTVLRMAVLGYTFAEIGKHIGLSESRVSQLYHVAVREIQKEILR